VIGHTDGVTKRFPLAPMSATMWVSSAICAAVPVGMLFAASRAPAPVRGVLGGVALAVVAIYAFVALWLRPTRFVVDDDTLEIVWPLRARRIERASIVRARQLDRGELKAELGDLIRIGAGGLWGGFGLARTARGVLELWVSRIDRIVYVECDGRRSLLITPRDPRRFVQELERRR
jgi:hypothetical protein